jgi:RNA polymerase sigma-70 factor (ECF subfamily)
MSRPTAKELLRETPSIRHWLRHCGVRHADLDDVTSDVIGRAWESIARGGFRPYPDIKPRYALRAWLQGVTWRRASTFLNRAYLRHEVLVEQVPDRTTTDEGEVIARSELTLLCGIPLKRRAVLLAHAAGCGMPEIAKALGIPVSTGWTLLRLARVDLLAILKRRAARDGR